jgi:formylglycine-generating enzyme required for sulfatase activity
MRLVDSQGSQSAFCIDTYEAPGHGIIPVTNLTVEQARLACAQRNRRLCAGDEWEAACRGKASSFYPYGMRYDAKRCNVRDAGKRVIEAAGSWPECASAAGVYDLSGNVSEWVEEGITKGGSTTDGEDGRCSRSTRRPPGASAADIGYRCCAATAP